MLAQAWTVHSRDVVDCTCSHSRFCQIGRLHGARAEWPGLWRVRGALRHYGCDQDSPEVVKWLCEDRKTEMPDGVAIIKPMRLINTNLDIQPGTDLCMDINNQEDLPVLWATMIKTSDQSCGGGYW